MEVGAEVSMLDAEGYGRWVEGSRVGMQGGFAEDVVCMNLREWRRCCCLSCRCRWLSEQLTRALGTTVRGLAVMPATADKSDERMINGCACLSLAGCDLSIAVWTQRGLC